MIQFSNKNCKFSTCPIELSDFDSIICTTMTHIRHKAPLMHLKKLFLFHKTNPG